MGSMKEENDKSLQEFLMKKKSWRKRIAFLLFDLEEPTFTQVSLTLSLYTFVGSVIYQITSPTFFPSAEWQIIGGAMILILAGSFGIYFFKKYFQGQINFKQHSNNSFIQFALTCFTPVFLYFFLQWGIVYGMANVITAFLGDDDTNSIQIVEKLDPAYPPGLFKILKDKEYCLKADRLETGLLSRLCITKELYGQLEEKDSLVLAGKQTWFGFKAQKYYLPREESD